MLALAVSGGADSLALAVLAERWAAARGGRVVALVVDHGLRDGSAAEAALTLSRLAGRGIPGRCLTLQIAGGSRLAERARDARHARLEGACAEAGILHLLFGHHAADQAETIAMRRLRGSGPAGLAGMAALRETDQLRLLRPLLDVPPVRLRQTLRAAGLPWVEDPANADPAAERSRLRVLSRDRDGAGPLIRAAAEAAGWRGLARAAAERATAAWLARHVAIFPTGHALIADAAIPPPALAALIATLGGARRPPPGRQITRWLAAPGPATLGGVQIIRRRTGWLLVREAAALCPAVAATGRWDGRFLAAKDAGAAGWLERADPAGAPGQESGLPLAVARTMPQLRAADGSAMIGSRFAPVAPLTRAPFVTAMLGMQKPLCRPISWA